MNRCCNLAGSANAPYKLIFGTLFADQCGDATEGFIRGSQVSITPGTYASLIPISWFSTPN